MADGWRPRTVTIVLAVGERAQLSAVARPTEEEVCGKGLVTASHSILLNCFSQSGRGLIRYGLIPEHAEPDEDSQRVENGSDLK